MTEWSDAIKNAIVVVIIVVVVGIIFGFVYMAMQSNQEGQDKLSSQLSSFDEKSYSTYDGTQVSGQQVISCIQQYTGTDVAVKVNTATLPAGAWYCRSLTSAAAGGEDTIWELSDLKVEPKFERNGAALQNNSADKPTTIAAATTKDLVTYINPSAKFQCWLHRNKNGIVTGIECHQLVNGTKAS